MVFNRRNQRKRVTLSKKVKDTMKQIAFSTLETKHHRYNVPLTSITVDGLAIELNTVDSQGVAAGQFIGQEVRQMGLRLKGRFQQADSSNVLRYMICSLKTAFECDLKEGIVELNDLFYQKDNPLYSPLREASIGTVYKDRTLILNIAGAGGDDVKLFNHWIPLKMKKYYFQENSTHTPKAGGTIIYMFMWSDSAVSAHPTVFGHSTLYYKDG